MKKITVKNAFKNYRIFHYLSQVEFMEFFYEFPPDNLDSLYLSSFGKKTVSDFVTDNITENEVTETDIRNMVTIIHSMYASKWNRIYSIMASDLKLLENYQDTVTETVTDLGENNSDMETTNTDGYINKVSAYNNDDFVNKDSEDRTQQGTNKTKGNSKNERVREVKKTGFTGGAIKEYQTAIDYLQNNLIYDTIFKDINSLVTLQIYE